MVGWSCGTRVDPPLRRQGRRAHLSGLRRRGRRGRLNARWAAGGSPQASNGKEEWDEDQPSPRPTLTSTPSSTSNDIHDFPPVLGAAFPDHRFLRSDRRAPRLQGLRRPSMPPLVASTASPDAKDDGRRRRGPPNSPASSCPSLPPETLANPGDSVIRLATGIAFTRVRVNVVPKARLILPPCVMSLVQWIASVCSAPHEAMAAVRRFRSPACGPLNAVRSCSDFRPAFFEDRRVEPRGWVMGIDGDAELVRRTSSSVMARAVCIAGAMLLTLGNSGCSYAFVHGPRSAEISAHETEQPEPTNWSARPPTPSRSSTRFSPSLSSGLVCSGSWQVQAAGPAPVGASARAPERQSRSGRQ